MVNPKQFDQTKTTMLRRELASLLKGKYKYLLSSITAVIDAQHPSTINQIDAILVQVRKVFGIIDPSIEKAIGKYLRTSYLKGKSFATQEIQTQTKTKFSTLNFFFSNE